VTRTQSVLLRIAGAAILLAGISLPPFVRQKTNTNKLDISASFFDIIFDFVVWQIRLI
jgi:hypothetical protein